MYNKQICPVLSDITEFASVSEIENDTKLISYFVSTLPEK